ncbi:uncharacterized protein BDV17DRAFT_294577 [Aspergillus undulatus]|uniref:uncharacterized protein n=1 Tax=Aspergillus undulatus TaxID=1810928 RepID=UPI003CCDAA0A
MKLTTAATSILIAAMASLVTAQAPPTVIGTMRLSTVFGPEVYPALDSCQNRINGY